MADTLVLGTSALCVWVRVPRPLPKIKTKREITKMAKKITTQQAIDAAAQKLEADIVVLGNQKEDALAGFRGLVSNLETINAAASEKVESLAILAGFIAAQTEAAEQIIADNERVRSKILEILGV